MPYTQVTSGGYITSDWANTYVNNQVVATYSSTTDRNTNGPGTPTAGMLSVLTTNTATEGLYEYTSDGKWRLPWNMPWGYVAISALPNSFPFNTTLSFSSSTFTFSAINRRNYLVHFGGEFNNGTVTGVVDTASIHTSASTAGVPVPVSFAGIRATFPSVSGSGAAISQNSQETRSTAFVYTSTSTGTQTWKFAAISNASGTYQTFIPNLLVIQDIGPSGAPA